jgi:hypothetical protein
MFEDFTKGLFGEELKRIQQLQRDLLKANNVDNNIEDNNV